MTIGVCWYGDLLKWEYVHVLGRVLNFEIEGQSKEETV